MTQASSNPSDPHAATPLLQSGVPLASADRALILLHGRGGSAEDILQLGAALQLPGTACLAPQAADHTWYPMSFLAPREANEPYLTSALARIESVIHSIERAGLSRDRIVLAGFSQGACLSTEFVASHPARYAGLLAFTGGLIGPPGSLSQTPVGDLAGTPALLLSGDPDPHVPWARVEESAAILKAMGAAVTTRRFPGRPHTVTQQEVELARAMLLHFAEAR